MARECHCIRKGRENALTYAVVAVVDGVESRALERWMLDVEEGLVRVYLRRIPGHPLAEIAISLPVRNYEIIAFHAAMANRRPRLAERLLPAAGHAVPDERIVLRIPLGVHVERHVAVRIAVIVVIARAE